MPTSNDEGEILTLKQVAEFLKVTERTIYRLAAAKKIPACWRRFKSEPPCRLNFEPGLQASLRGPAVDKCSA